MMHRNTAPPGSPRAPGSRQRIYLPKSWMRSRNSSHAVLAATPTDERCMHHHETHVKKCEGYTRQYLRALRTGDLERLKDVPRVQSGKTMPRTNLHWWDIATLDRMAGVSTWKRTKMRKDWKEGKDMSRSLSEMIGGRGAQEELDEDTFELVDPPEPTPTSPSEPDYDEEEANDGSPLDGSKADKKKHGLTPEVCDKVQQKILDALNQVMKSNGFTRQDYAMARLVKRADKDGSECLNYNEFIKLIRSIQIDGKLLPEDGAKKFFKALDPDESGGIDVMEILAFAQMGSKALFTKKIKKMNSKTAR